MFTETGELGPSYTFPVVSPAAFIIRFSFVFGDVLILAISDCLVA